MHNPTERVAHTTTFVTLVVEHWMEWDIAQWVHNEGFIWRPTDGLPNGATYLPKNPPQKQQQQQQQKQANKNKQTKPSL